MKELSKEKRTQLVGVGAVIAVVLAGLWFGLVAKQQSRLRTLRSQEAEASQKYQRVRTTIANADKVQAELEARSNQLGLFERGMATGDLYSWAINTIREFKLNHKVEIPQFSQISGPEKSSLFPIFPYQQATITIAGTGFYYDLGNFVADLENEYPLIRLANLVVEPATATGAAEPEKLSFKLDVIALVKPNS